jgi:hypothetical protein
MLRTAGGTPTHPKVNKHIFTSEVFQENHFPGSVCLSKKWDIAENNSQNCLQDLDKYPTTKNNPFFCYFYSTILYCKD